jgi:hypothetical protein
MQVCILIRWHPGDMYQACVVTVDLARVWSKIYPSKWECASDVYRIGLLTIMDHDDLLKGDFDIENRTLMSETEVDADLLNGAGFVETTPAKLN